MFRLIIAEDEPETCENMIACINWELHGYEIVGVANDGGSAYSMICEKQPDVVLIDIRMPVMSGLEVIRRIREDNALSPVFIIISGYDTFTYAQEALHLKVDGYLLKPFNPDQLLLKLQETIPCTNYMNDLLSGNAQVRDTVRGLSRPTSDAEMIRYPYHLEQPIIQCLTSSGDSAELFQLVENFLDAAQKDNPDIYKFYHCFLILYAEICRLLSKNGCSVRQLRSLEKWNSTNAVAGIRSALHETIESASEALSKECTTSQTIRQVKEILSKRYMERLCLNDIADEVHITPVYLSSLFHKQTGFTLTSYLQQLRIDAAKEHLSNTDYSISEIAERVGYPDTKYFSEVFKRITGLSPNAYRNKAIRH